MNLAIVHYHLQAGGVTRVIELQLRALNAVFTAGERLRVSLLHGGSDSGPGIPWLEELHALDVSVKAIPELAYDMGRPGDPDALTAALRGALSEAGFAPRETLIHAHNHALGKNARFPGTLSRLAHEGYGLLLQIHDFAEDFRAEDYRHLCASLAPEDPARLPSLLYPQGAQIHYAVLNGRDKGVLLDAGVPAERLHQLVNPVISPATVASRKVARKKLARQCSIDENRDIVLYPVRCIRRKNVGETLLWSSLARGKATFCFTLAPENPRELPAYRAWKSLARSLGLPCAFETGAVESGISFGENLAAADRLITTSVAEGFGMVFLEAWLTGRPLIGRDLPEITGDFVAAGLRFDDLRDAFRVPVDLIGAHTYKESLVRAYRQTLEAYRRPPPPPSAIAKEAESSIHDNCVDFARLVPGLQRGVLKRINDNAGDRHRIRDLNPWLEQALIRDGENARETIEDNVAVIESRYSLEACGDDLRNVYAGITSGSRDDVPGALSRGGAILDAFLSLDRFHPLRAVP